MSRILSFYFNVAKMVTKTGFFWFIYLFFAVFCFLNVSANVELNISRQIEVYTNRGSVEGQLIVTSSGFRGWGFQGIPYAEPPVLKLRFRKPVAKSPWKERLICNEYKPACWQNMTGTGETEESVISEDCLYLNVFVSEACLNGSIPKCPVIYYIHGGGNEFDSPRMFAPETLLENFASRKIVFLTISYRLNVFGFWTTTLEDAPGNLAFYDMILGAQWIQEEIRNFGGDPNRVTIQGHSSSAMAISLLTMSPKTEDLFQQAIMMSGSACKRYEAVSNRIDHYGKLAQTLKCTTEKEWRKNLRKNGPKILECMQKIDVDILGNKFNEIRGNETATGNSKQMTLARIDGPEGLFPYPLEEMIARRRPMTIITGTTKNEVGYTKYLLINATESDLKESCKVFVQNQLYNRPQTITQECGRFYSQNDSFSPENGTPFWDKRITELSQDVQYFAPSHIEASSMVARGGRVYLYSFDYVKKGMDSNMAPFHAFDMVYLIGLHADKYPFDKRDLQLQQRYIDLLANFVHYGNPTPRFKTDLNKNLDNVTWQSFEHPNDFQYLSIDLPLKMQNHYHRKSIVFWNYEVPMIDDGFDQFTELSNIEYKNSGNDSKPDLSINNNVTMERTESETKSISLVIVLIIVIMLISSMIAVILDRRLNQSESTMLLRNRDGCNEQNYESLV